MGYRYDIRHLSAQQQAIIRHKDLNYSLHKDNLSSIQNTEIYPLKIFMKLGLDSITQYNDRQTLKTYKQFLGECLVFNRFSCYGYG